MNRQHKKNSILILLQVLTSSILALITPAIIIRSLSFEGFSTWTMLITIGSIVSFFNLGIENGLIKITTESIAKKDNKLMGSLVYYASFLYILVAFLAILTLLCALYLFSNLSNIIFDKIDIQIILIYLFIISINLLTIPFISIIKGFARYDIFSLIEIIISIFNFLSITILLYCGLQYYALLSGVVISIITRLILSFFYSIRLLRLNFGKLECSNFIFNERIVLYKFATSDLITRIYSIGIPFLIKSSLLKVGGINLVGYYEIAARVSSISNMITPIYSTFLPEFVKNNYHNKLIKNIKIVSFCSRFISLIYLPIIAYLIYFLDDILLIWIQQNNEFLLFTTSVLLISSFIEILTGPLTTLLNSMGSFRIIIYKIIFEAFCYLTFVSVSVFFSSAYLIIGSEFLSVLLATFFLYYKTNIFIDLIYLKITIKNILIISLTSLLILFPIYAIYGLVNNANIILLIFAFLVYILFLLILFLKFKLITKNEYLKLISFLLKIKHKIL